MTSVSRNPQPRSRCWAHGSHRDMKPATTSGAGLVASAAVHPAAPAMPGPMRPRTFPPPIGIFVVRVTRVLATLIASWQLCSKRPLIVLRGRRFTDSLPGLRIYSGQKASRLCCPCQKFVAENLNSKKHNHHSTVTDFAKLRGLSTSVPRAQAV